MSKEMVEIQRALGSELHERLERWGRVMRPTPQAGLSPTYEICQRLALLAGVVEVKPAAGLMEWVRVEAQETEIAWSFMVVPLEAKKALAYLYVAGLPPHIVARKVKCSVAAVVTYSVTAGRALNRTLVNIRENGLPEDNRAYNSLTG